MDHPNLAHEQTRRDLEEGKAGPCKVCNTYMASRGDGFVCTGCLQEKSWNFCVGQDVPGCDLVTFNEQELMQALKSGEESIDGISLVDLCIEGQGSSDQDILNVIEAFLPELTARYQFDVREAFMRLRWI